MSITTFASIDLIDFLQLDKKLTRVEQDELLSELSLELWYRFLNIHLAALISPEDLKKLTEKNMSLEEIIEWAQENYPHIDMMAILESVSYELKKEFIKTYVIKFLEDKNIQNDIDLYNMYNIHIKNVLNELDKTNPNISLIRDEIDFIVKLTNS